MNSLSMLPKPVLDVLRSLYHRIRKIRGAGLYATSSWSQEGEDLVLKRLFDSQQSGFYVDVGCHHPYRFSNTYLFYLKGWAGLCIDPLPGTASAFAKARARDLVLEAGVSDEPGQLVYYMFNEPALNTFDESLAEERRNLPGCAEVGKRLIAVRTLEDILDELLPQDIHQIDFLSIDVEGLDYKVLRSNNWQKYSPRAVVLESYENGFSDIEKSEMGRFMAEHGYSPYAKTGYSVVYVAAERIRT